MASQSGTERYTVTNPSVAQCLFGHVMRGRLRQESDVEAGGSADVALKVFDTALARARTTSAGVPVAEHAQREFDVLWAVARAPHRHLMGMHPVTAKLPNGAVKMAGARGSLIAVLPWMHHGDLMSHLLDADAAAMTVDTVRHHFVGLASGLAHLHKLGFAHRDVSLENIMLSRDGVAVLGDYGAAAPVGHYPAPRVRPGKTGYVAPEIYSRRSTGYDAVCADVYSLGVVLFCLLARCMPYERPSTTDPCFAAIRNGQMPQLLAAWGLTHRFAQGALPLVRSMMHLDPTKRPTLKQVLAHPWCRAAVAVAAAAAAKLSAEPQAEPLASACSAAPRKQPAVVAAAAPPSPDQATRVRDATATASPAPDASAPLPATAATAPVDRETAHQAVAPSRDESFDSWDSSSSDDDDDDEHM